MRRQRGFGLIFYVIAGIAILAMLSTIAYRIRESGKDAVRVEWAEANRLQREKEAAQADTAAKALEAKREKSKIVYRTLTKEVDRIVTRVEYRDRECFDDDGLRVIRAAIRGEVAPAAVPDKPLPRAPGTTGRQIGIRLAMDRGGF